MDGEHGSCACLGSDVPEPKGICGRSWLNRSHFLCHGDCWLAYDRGLLDEQGRLDRYGPVEGSRTGAETNPSKLRCTRICADADVQPDRKSTRLNSSHLGISYAVF